MNAKKKDNVALGTGLDELLELMEMEVIGTGLELHLDAIDDGKETGNAADEARPKAEASMIEELFGTGLQSLKRGDYVVAAAHFLAVTLLEPRHIKALNNLGVSWFYLRKPDEALKAFEQVLNIDPENETAKNNIQEILKSHHKEAEK